VKDYVDWLRGYLARGGAIMYARDYPMSHGKFLVATGDFTLGGECGAVAASIIARPGVRWTRNPHVPDAGRGHNQLFFMDGFIHVGNGAAVYSDAEFAALPGYADAVAAEEARWSRLEAERLQRLPSEHSSLGRYWLLADDVLRSGVGPA
jgi:hypothetical protein